MYLRLAAVAAFCRLTDREKTVSNWVVIVHRILPRYAASTAFFHGCCPMDFLPSDWSLYFLCGMRIGILFTSRNTKCPTNVLYFKLGNSTTFYCFYRLIACNGRNLFWSLTVQALWLDVAKVINGRPSFVGIHRETENGGKIFREDAA